MRFSEWLEKRELLWVEEFAYDLISEVREIMSDEELLAAIKAGDESAWGPLLARWEPRIHRFLSKKLNNTADADEVAQDVLMKIVVAIRKQELPRDFKNWAYAIAKNTASNLAKKPRPVSIEDPEEMSLMQGSKRMGREALAMPSTKGSQLDRMVDDETKQRIHQAMDDLATTGEMGQRKADYLRKFYFDDKGISDIAGGERPEGTVKRTLHYARKDMEKRLMDKDEE